MRSCSERRYFRLKEVVNGMSLNYLSWMLSGKSLEARDLRSNKASDLQKIGDVVRFCIFLWSLSFFYSSQLAVAAIAKNSHRNALQPKQDSTYVY